MVDPNKNCHNYRQYGRMCRYKKGEDGIDPYECAMFYKLDDLNNEAKDIREEQEKEFEGVDDW